jgi:hypothetical protein
MDGGGAGLAYERIMHKVFKHYEVRATFYESGGVVDFHLPDYRALLQVKTNQGGKSSADYQFGKTVAKVRGEAVMEAEQKISEQFIDTPSVENLYLSSFNFGDNTLDIYHLAQHLNNRFKIINNFTRVQPRGFNPDAPVGNELKFKVTTLERVYRCP